MSFNRLFFFSLFILLFSATAMSQSVSLSDTVSIADTELTLLSNTSQCLTDCEAWLEWDLREAVSDKRASTKSDSVFGFEFLKKSNKTKTLKSFGIEVWKEFDVEVSDFGWVEEIVEREPLDVTGKTVACKDIGCVDGKKSGLCDCVGVVWKETGSHFEKRFNKVANTPYNFNFKKGNKYRFRVWGKKNPQLGENDVDWIPTILGERISEWAWWSSSWKTRYQLTWTAPYDLNVGNVVHFGDIDFSAMDIVMDDLNDYRVVYNDVTDLNRWVEGTSASTDGNLWIKLDNGLSAGVQTAFYIYTNNAAAGTPNKHISYLVDGFEDGEYTSNLVWIAKNANTEADSSVQSVIKHDGTYALKVDNQTDTQPYLETTFASEQNPNEISTFMYCTNVAKGGAVKYISATAVQMFPEISVGTFQVYTGAYSIDTTVVPLNDTWYLLKTVFDWTANTANFEFWNSTITTKLAEVKDVNITTFSGITKIQLGRAGNDIGEQVYFDKSDVNVVYSLGSAEIDIGVTASFSTAFNPAGLNVEAGIASLAVDFNSISIYSETAISNKGYRWDFNGVTYSYDQNLTRTFTVVADYNVCLDANATIDGINYSNQACSTVSILSYPQNVDFNFTPASPSRNETIRFQASSDLSDVEWVWGFGDGNFSTGQDINHSFPIGDWNVCLTAIAPVDLNTQHCESIEIFGLGLVQFYDENTGSKLVPTTLIVDGTSYVADVNADGVLNLALSGWSSGNHTIIASLADYGSREWVIDFNEFSYFFKNFSMLEDANGGIINFKFYDTDESTILANATIQVMIEDVNYASSKQTNASGEVSFFLNPDDANYSFHIIKADETTLDYYQPTVTIKIPKDEETLATLTAEAFDVQLGGVASRSYLGNTTDLVFKIFPNTVDYYQAQVDYNSAAYLSRTYSFKTKGDTSTITIQPYLPKTANGATIYFYVIDSVNSDSIEGVLVEASRTGGVLAGKTVEQEHTDSSGAAIFSLLINEQYRMNFFIDGDLVYSIKLVATSTTYTVRIDRTGGGSMTDYVDSRTFVEFIPGIGYLESAGGIIGFDVNIFSPTGIISDVNITVFQDGNFVMNIYGSDSDGNYFVFSIDLNSLDSNHAIVVDVNIFKTSGITEHYSHVYIIKTPSTYNILYTLRSAELREELGGDLALNVIAFFITLFVVASFGITVTTKFEGLFAIAAVVMFFFVYIGWVNGILYGLALVGGFSAVIASKRFG